MNEKPPDQVKEFSVENCPNGNLAKVAKFHTNPYNFSSSKYFYSWLRL